VGINIVAFVNLYRMSPMAQILGVEPLRPHEVGATGINRAENQKLEEQRGCQISKGVRLHLTSINLHPI